MDRREAVDRVLRVVLRVAKRIDPSVTGLHTVRTTKPDWAGGLSVVEDACMPPERGMVGAFPDYPSRGVHSIDFPYRPRAKVTITVPDASRRPAPGTLDDMGGPLCVCGERLADHVHGARFGCGNFRRAKTPQK